MKTQELIEKCASGDAQAFDVLVRTYQTKIINIAYGMLQNKEDAYDVAQEVFIKIYRNIGAFTGKASLDTWTKPLSPFYATCLASFQRQILGSFPALFFAPNPVAAVAECAKKRPPEGGLFAVRGQMDRFITRILLIRASVRFAGLSLVSFARTLVSSVEAIR